MEYTKEEYQEDLKALQSKLETGIETKATDIVTAQLKAVTDKIEAIKGLPESITAEALQTMLKTVQTNVEDFDKWQVKMDAFVKGGAAPAKAEVKSFGENLATAMDEKFDDFEKFKRKEIKSVAIELKAVGDVTTANNTGTRYGQQYSPNIITQPTRKQHIRNLVPTVNVASGNSFTFPYENGAGEGSIAATSESATKPQFDVDFAEKTAQFETIAGWMRFSNKIMRNFPGFLQFLQTRIPEKWLRVEDAMLLTGDGISPNLKGIIQAGNFTAATTTATTLVEQLMDTIAQAEDADRNPDGILVKPSIWMSLFKNKSAGSGEFDLPLAVNFQNGVLYVGDVPIYKSTAMGATQFIVGEWAMGAQLLIQEGMRLEFFDQDGTNVRENKITLRIEGTEAFPVFGSDFFYVGTVA